MTEEEMEEAAERAMNAASHLLSSNPSHAKTWPSGLIVVPHYKICAMILPKITHKIRISKMLGGNQEVNDRAANLAPLFVMKFEKEPKHILLIIPENLLCLSVCDKIREKIKGSDLRMQGDVVYVGKKGCIIVRGLDTTISLPLFHHLYLPFRESWFSENQVKNLNNWMVMGQHISKSFFY
jgi:hypothetical protein